MPSIGSPHWTRYSPISPLSEPIPLTVMYRDLENMVSNSGNLYRTVPHVNDTAVYFFGDGAACCAACANGENDSDASPMALDPQWEIVGYAPAMEVVDGLESAPECAHCGEPVADVA